MNHDDDPTEYVEDEREQDELPIERATPAERKAAGLPIGQVETEETMEGRVRITRSLSLGSKNDQIHLGIEHPYQVQPGWSLSQQAVAIADTCGLIKSLVYSQLGLDFTIDDEGVLREVIKTFPGAERVREPRPERRPARDDDDEPRDEPRRRDNGGGRFTHPADMDRPQHVDREVWADLCENYEDWFDNRSDKAAGKYKDTAPDFKRAEDGTTVWLRPFRRDGNRSGPRTASRGRGYDR